LAVEKVLKKATLPLTGKGVGHVFLEGMLESYTYMPNVDLTH
jgi:hypothetical protein